MTIYAQRSCSIKCKNVDGCQSFLFENGTCSVGGSQPEIPGAPGASKEYFFESTHIKINRYLCTMHMVANSSW